MNQLFEKIMPLHFFMPLAQVDSLVDNIRGEEGEFFIAKITETADIIAAMPKTYEQDGLGDQAIVHLHYFKGACDWYITERDMEEQQLQAFGMADLGYGGELGYINIEEIIKFGVELDLYWKPVTLETIKLKQAA